MIISKIPRESPHPEAGKYKLQCNHCKTIFYDYNCQKTYCDEPCAKSANLKTRRERKEQARNRVCEYCQDKFKSRRNDTKFCSDACKQAAYRNRIDEKESRQLYTIGYQERRLPDFIDELNENGIRHLIDIRYSTKSQFKSEFSEDTLKYVLEYAGIAYTSNKKLGVPFDIQHPYKDGEMSIPEFERRYKDHINEIDKNELAAEIKKPGKTALMCYEKEASGNEMKVKGKEKFKIDCHRSILANILKETGEFDEIINL